ncbi:MAG: biotin-dependent carboxyltransferase family protein [Flavobacteriaceae bacterium]|nr:biotin-dependent carboxyltransferase family protein [Flavobacteriaceae bacterium]
MIKVMASGLYTSLQDLGRFGYRHLGVPLSGAMDMQAALEANNLVGNTPELTVMECTASGPVLKFETKAVVAICGALFALKLDGVEIELNKAIEIPVGGVLSFGTPSKGIRAYMAIQGGFNSEKVLGSNSFYQGITNQFRLRKGDVINFYSNTEMCLFDNTYKYNGINDFDSEEIEVMKGPEFNDLSEEFQSILNNTKFVIASNSNRMAYTLDHSLHISAKEIITAPVQPGTVQLTPSGKLILLMRDAQTTGGYARTFQLTKSAINKLAQKRAGMVIRFKIVDLPFHTRV